MRRAVRNLTAALLVLALAACGHEEAAVRHTTPADAAIAYYDLLVKGQYADFVAGMQSCDSVTDAYREQMVTLIKQHYVEAAKVNGGLHAASVVRTQVIDDTLAANVFLNLTYNDSTSEEIVQPMVWDGQQWRMR